MIRRAMNPSALYRGALAVAAAGLLCSASTASAAPAPPHIGGGVVDAIAPDGSGGYFIGGSFTSIDGVAVQNAAHILANGTLDRSWAPDPNGCGSSEVYAIAVSGSTVYLGGGFCSITSSPGRVTVARNEAAAVNAGTGTVTAWNPSPMGLVQALAISGSTVYIGGEFNAVENSTGTAPVSRTNAAAVNASTGFATGWDPDPNGYVGALAVSGSTVYLGGRFSAITDSAGTGSVARYNAAAVSATTGDDTGWDPDPAFNPAHPGSGYVDALAVSGSTVYLGGNFLSIAGSSGAATVKRSNVAAVNAATGRATAWNPSPSGAVLSIATSGSTVYFGGQFGKLLGPAGASRVERDFAAAVSAGTGRDTGWTPGPPAPIAAIAVAGSTAYLAGSSYAGTASTGVAAIKHVRTSRGGDISVGLSLPGPGSIKVVATVSGGHVVFARTSARARKGGTLTVKLTPSASAASLLRRRHRLKLTLSVSYTPLAHNVVTLERAGIPVTS
jgi:hypothetical protein